MNALVIGDHDRCEFSCIAPWIDFHSTVYSVPDVNLAASFLQSCGHDIDLFVLLQSYPGQFTTRDVERIRRWAPLASFVSVLGAWCDGEMRTGQPIPGVRRIAWHQWNAELAAELEAAQSGGDRIWEMPPTSSQDEYSLARSNRRLRSGKGLVAVVAQLAETAAAISDACQVSGYSTVWISPSKRPVIRGVSACVVDVVSDRESARQELSSLRKTMNHVPIVALVGFLRQEEEADLRQQGTISVVSKPYYVEHLLWHVAQAIESVNTLVME